MGSPVSSDSDRKAVLAFVIRGQLDWLAKMDSFVGQVNAMRGVKRGIFPCGNCDFVCGMAHG